MICFLLTMDPGVASIEAPRTEDTSNREPVGICCGVSEIIEHECKMKMKMKMRRLGKAVITNEKFFKSSNNLMPRGILPPCIHMKRFCDFFYEYTLQL